MTSHFRGRGLAATLGALLVIGYFTLSPAPGEPRGNGTPWWCISCSDLTMVDTLANVRRFFPLAIGLHLRDMLLNGGGELLGYAASPFGTRLLFAERQVAALLCGSVAAAVSVMREKRDAVLLLGISGSDAIPRTRAPAADLRLRSPALRLRESVRPQTVFALQGGASRALSLRSSDTSGQQERLGLSTGLGSAWFWPFETAPGARSAWWRRTVVLSAVALLSWYAALAFAVPVAVTLGFTVGALGLLLPLRVTPAVPATPLEPVGFGLGLGVIAAGLVARRRVQVSPHCK